MANSHIANNLNRVIESINSIKDRYGIKHDITLIGVSKYSNEDDIYLAYKAGLKDFGENKVQDLIKKASNIESKITHEAIKWHFIGRLQENKINQLLRLKPYMLHSLHSLKLANALQARLKTNNETLETLLQVNSANEDSKQGFSIDTAIESYLQVQETCPNIKLQGLMCMGANVDIESKIAQSFQITYKLFDGLKLHGAKILSMGMSGDYEIAIKEGSNCVRIGSSIFKSAF